MKLMLIFTFLILSGCGTYNATNIMEEGINIYNTKKSFGQYTQQHLVYIVVISCKEDDVVEASISYTLSVYDMPFIKKEFFTYLDGQFVILTIKDCDKTINQANIYKMDSITLNKVRSVVYDSSNLITGAFPSLIITYKKGKLVDTLYYQDGLQLPSRLQHLSPWDEQLMRDFEKQYE